MIATIFNLRVLSVLLEQRPLARVHARAEYLFTIAIMSASALTSNAHKFTPNQPTTFAVWQKIHKLTKPIITGRVVVAYVPVITGHFQKVEDTDWF